MRKLRRNQVQLVANGDLRLSANQSCWAAQKAMEDELVKAVKACGYELVRMHPYKPAEKHGFIGSQKEGMQVFRNVDPGAKIMVAEAVWQYTHHILHGLITHKAPILTVANWSGQWPGLVGMLNLNGSMTAAGVKYSTLWSEDFSSAEFMAQLKTWLRTGRIVHKTPHVKPLSRVKLPARERKLGADLAAKLKCDKAIMGIFDEGCMGMFNALIPDSLLNPLGIYKERLSQSALYYAATQVKESEARAALRWLTSRGMRFMFGSNDKTDLTVKQVLWQLRAYIAAIRIADEFGCSTVGIQYQQGLKDLLPASDLVEGLLNDSVRPPVRSADGKRVLYAGRPVTNFNEVDECSGVDAILTVKVQEALRQPVENTLHDVRWADWDRSGTTGEYVWVFEISGSVPPSHFPRGLKDAVGERQPPMYFRLGGATIKGISKPGEITWSRIFIEDNRLKMDIGRAKVVELPLYETRRRWNSTTPQWPIMHAVLYGITRDQFMAKHKANHIQVVYSRDAKGADSTMYAKAAMARALGLEVNVCGTRKCGGGW